ncbi:MULTISPECIES: glycine-rich protein, partial [unclassified Flavobacterium]
MKKTTQFKIRWLSLGSLILLMIALFMPNMSMWAQTYTYTGSVQTVTLPAGSYQIEMWGANGGGTQGGIGGYSKGEFAHTGGTLYIVVGGAGGTGGIPSDLNGGYNGGGARPNPGGATRGSGGGATHISKSTGLLSDATVRSNIVIVAGGAGGGSNAGTGVGGGGGVTGANSNGPDPGQGGTQTAGGVAGAGTSGSPGTAGQGGQSLDMAGAGGGGWYGGGAGGGSIMGNTGNGGGGGSGYVGGLGVTNGITLLHTQPGFVVNPDTSGNGLVVIKSLIPCTGTPTVGTASATTRVCASQPFILSVSGATMGGGLIYQWQSATSTTGPWIDINGASGFSYTETNQTGTTYYRFVVTCTNSNSMVTSNIVNVTQPAATGVFYENFDAVTTGTSTNNTVPTCWTYLNKAASGYGYTTTTAARTGKGFYTYRPSTTGEMLLISPQTDNLGNGTKQVRFWAKASSSTYVPTQNLGVYTMDGVTATATLTLVQNNMPLTDVWQEFIVPLPTTTDDYFAFSFDSKNGTTYVYLDDVYYEDLSPCIFPMNLKVSAITQTSATISWDASKATGVTGYEYEIRTSGAAGSGATGLEQTGAVNAPATSVNITNLSASTSYIVYVRSKCGTSNGAWTPYPIKFNTVCGVVTGNFFEGFENTAVGSSSNITYPLCWTYINTVTPTTSAYGCVNTNAKNTGNNGFYTYRSSTATANGDLLLISPETDNLGNGGKRLRFWAKVSATSYSPKFEIYTMDGNTVTANKTLLKTINLTTNYTEYIVYLPVSTTDDYFAFSFDRVGAASYVYLDDVYYEDAPSCRPIDDDAIKITNVSKNSVDISWQDLFNFNPVAYEVEVRATGNPGTPGAAFIGTTAVGVTNIIATGLSASTQYKVYIRSICSTTDKSDWTQAQISPTTLCDYPDFISGDGATTICGSQSIDLTATYDKGIVYWYDGSDPTTSNLVHTGSVFTTPVISNNTSYWHYAANTAATAPITVGPVNPNAVSASQDAWTIGWNVLFTVHQSTNLNTIDIFPVNSNETGAIQIRQGGTASSTPQGTLLKTVNYTTSVSGGATPQKITIDIDLPPGTYNLHPVLPSSGLRRNTAGASYPYASSVASITGNGYLASYYMGFYNWLFKAPVCSSPMTEVAITVAPKPLFDLSTDKVSSCDGNASSSVRVVTNLGGYDTFTWSP